MTRKKSSIDQNCSIPILVRTTIATTKPFQCRRISVSVSIYVFLSVSVSVSIYVFLSVSVSLYVFLSVSVSLYAFLSVSVSFCFCFISQQLRYFSARNYPCFILLNATGFATTAIVFFSGSRVFLEVSNTHTMSTIVSLIY